MGENNELKSTIKPYREEQKVYHVAHGGSIYDIFEVHDNGELTYDIKEVNGGEIIWNVPHDNLKPVENKVD